MPLWFRAPGIPLRVEEILARLAPARAARDSLRSERLRFAHTHGVGNPWTLAAPIRDLEAELPAAAALCLDDESRVASRDSSESEFELELPALVWPAGVVPVRGGHFTFEVLETSGDRSRVRFRCEAASRERVCEWAAQAGSPVIGDFARGGSLAGPGEPLFAPGGALRVSEAAARAIARGHPWLTRDRESEDEGRFAPGALVDVRAAGTGRTLGAARIEGGPQLVARMWAATQRGVRVGAKPPKAASIEARVVRALARREKLRASAATGDSLRLVHSEADALPGLFADRFGGVLRVVVTGRAALPIWERATAALAAALGEELGREPSVIAVLNLRPQPSGDLACVRQLAGPPVPDPLVVREGPLAFRIDGGLAEPARPHTATGFFPDQRANRAALAARVRAGGRYLNLFAHTGAFSAALLAAGAGEVTSVDLSGPYLARLEENLQRSGVALERHHSLKRDVRRFLAELATDAQFDGIVLDPPTAASAGRSFWSARQGLEALVADCLRHLAPGGFLLVSSNDRQARGKLAQRVEAAAVSAGVGHVALHPAPPSADFPSLAGFPEGAAFEAVLAERRR